jgi:Cu+-exporting ATPase
MKKEVYTVEGMSCAACSSAVERVTRKLPGVKRSDVNLTTGKLLIEYDERAVTPDMIIAKVTKAGFGCQPLTPEKQSAEKSGNNDPELRDLRDRGRNLIGAAILTILLLYVSMGQMIWSGLPVPPFADMHDHPQNFALTQLLLTVPVLYFGRRFFTSGIKALIHLNPNMDSLVAVGSGCSFLYSVVIMYLMPQNPQSYVHSLYFESSATVITLIMLGKYLEARSKRKTKGAITKLMELAPDTALLAVGDTVTEVPADTLKPGDTVLVKPGARIPADGTVAEGSGAVDESMLTGESLPVEKTVGSTVTGGSLSINGAFYVRVERTGADTTLASIIRFVEDAQGKKAPISKTADRVAGFFVPMVIAIACIAAVIWLIAGKEFSFALRIFTSVLVIACPCAMGLATPTAIMVGTGLGASKGILIRSGEALETVHTIDTVVLDKTGTITEGKPAVTEIVDTGCGADILLQITASAESQSGHPLAMAVCEKAGGIALLKVSEFQDMAGRGISARLEDGRTVTVGSRRILDGLDVPAAVQAAADRVMGQGQTAVFTVCDGQLLGMIAISDTVRETSKAAIAELHRQGRTVYMITGDNRAAAEYIGQRTGVDHVIAEVLPEDKAAKIKELQASGKKVMMVGDGINDAPALAQADIGAAIGAGSDIAIESGDIVLMKSDLRDIPRAIRLSELTIRNIKQNLFWAFFYNTIGIPIAAGILYPFYGILLSPMIGGFAMSLSSVCVVTNALRLRRKKL